MVLVGFRVNEVFKIFIFINRISVYIVDVNIIFLDKGFRGEFYGVLERGGMFRVLVKFGFEFVVYSREGMFRFGLYLCWGFS